MTVNWTHWLTGCKQLLAIRSSTGCNIVLVSFIVTHILCPQLVCAMIRKIKYTQLIPMPVGVDARTGWLERRISSTGSLPTWSSSSGLPRTTVSPGQPQRTPKVQKRISCISRVFLGVNDIWRGGLTRFVTYYFVFLETLYTVTHRFRENI